MPAGRSRGVITPRQLEILEAVAKGRPTKEIAADLGISQQAVKAHLTRMYEALDAPNRAALVARAMALGLLKRR